MAADQPPTRHSRLPITAKQILAQRTLGGVAICLVLGAILWSGQVGLLLLPLVVLACYEWNKIVAIKTVTNNMWFVMVLVATWWGTSQNHYPRAEVAVGLLVMAVLVWVAWVVRGYQGLSLANSTPSEKTLEGKTPEGMQEPPRGQPLGQPLGQPMEQSLKGSLGQSFAQWLYKALWNAIGGVYIAVAAICFWWLAGGGLELLVWFIATVAVGDIASYIGGTTLKGRLLMPSISPKKTVAGLWSGVMAAGVVGLALAMVLGLSEPASSQGVQWGLSDGGLASQAGSASQGGVSQWGVSWGGVAQWGVWWQPAQWVLPYWGLGLWFGASLALGIVGAMGDGFESYFKRKFGAKDSSNLLPSHGGVLDIIDSHLSGAIFLAMILV